MVSPTINEVMSQFGREGKRSGRWTLYVCPFHPDNDPSFGVHDESPEWGHCFGCGTNAHVVRVYAELAGVSYEEASSAMGITSSEMENTEESWKRKHDGRIRRNLRNLSAKFFEPKLQDSAVRSFLAEKMPYLVKNKQIRDLVFPIILLPQDFDKLASSLRKLFPVNGFPKSFDRSLEGRILFPILESNDEALSLWGFVGRAIPGLREKPKYKTVKLFSSSRPRPLFPAHLPPKDGECFLVEGVTDALCARSRGIPALSALGAVGSNIVEPLKRYLKRFPDLETIYLVPDADSGGKSAFAKSWDKLLEEFKNYDLRVIELPPNKDLDEVLEEGTKIEDLPTCPLLEYLERKARATHSPLSPPPPPSSEGNPSGEGGFSLEVSVSELRNSKTAAQTFYKQAKPLELLFHLESLPEEQRKKTLVQIAKVRGISESELRDLLAQAALERLLESGRSSEVFLNPVLDYDHKYRIASLGFSARVSVLGEPKTQNFFVLSVDKGSSIGCFLTIRPEFAIPDNEVKVFFEKPRYQLPDIDEVWSATALGELVQRIGRGDSSLFEEFYPSRVFREIRNVVRKYLYLEKDIFYDVLAAYIVLSYFHQIFWSLPFLFIYGNKGTGKSRAMRLFHHLAFNAVLLERGTSAAFCDLFDRRATGLIDQAESLAYTRNLDVVSMLASSYTKETGKRYVVEIVRGERRQRRFDLFGPKVIASFREPLFDLKDRLVVIPFVKAPEDISLPDPTSEAEDWRKLRGRLYSFYLLYAGEVAGLYRQELSFSAFTGRSAEIFVPLAVIFKFVGLPQDRIHEVFEFFEEMIREISPLVYDRDVQVLESLLEVLSRGFAGPEDPVEVLTGTVVSLLKETGWEESRTSLRAYVEEIIRRNRALLRTIGPGRFITTRRLVEKALDRLRQNPGRGRAPEPRVEFSSDSVFFNIEGEMRPT